MNKTHPRWHRGFTLMEMVVSLVVLGLISVVMLPLLQLPANSYMDAQRRVELHQQLALIKSKLSDDLRLAMPGSLRTRQVGNRYYLEYLEVRATARVRQQSGGAAFCAAAPACRAGNALAGGACPDDCATTLGPAQVAVTGVNPVVNTDFVAVPRRGNEAQPNQPLPYTFAPNGTLSRLTNWTPRANDVGFRIQANAFAAKPATWDAARMYVISQPVTYECNETTGQLRKLWGYNITTAQQAPPVVNQNVAVLADSVRRCPLVVVTQGLRQTVSWPMMLSRTLAGQPVEAVEALIQLGVREP